jgi:hypothetical protein
MAVESLGAPYPPSYARYGWSRSYHPRTDNRTGQANLNSRKQAEKSRAQGQKGRKSQNQAATEELGGSGKRRHSEEAQSEPSNDNDDQTQGIREAGSLFIGENEVVSVLQRPTDISPNALRYANVYARNGDLTGDIDQILLDTEHGRVAYLLLRGGGISRDQPDLVCSASRGFDLISQ